MDTPVRVLHDGLRLSLLQRPRRTPLRAGFGTFLSMALLLLGLRALLQWPGVEAPRLPYAYGLQSEATAWVLVLAAAALVCAVAGRRALLWPVAAWLLAAQLLPNAVSGSLPLFPSAPAWLAVAVGWGVAAWSFLILLRLAHFTCEGAWPRALAAALLAAGLLTVPWFWLPQSPLWTTAWDEDAAEAWEEPGQIEEAEATMYAQPERLEAALAALAPQRPGHPDLYAVAFGGDAGEDVFRNEVEFMQRLLPARFDAQGHVLALLNHPDQVARGPLATATNLERALRGVGRQMDVHDDVLFLYLTSHGSEDHQLYVNQPPLPLDQLTPSRLRAALDAAGIRWRVVVVSACYSGGYVEALRDPRTLVITAARADRTSFGCGAQSEITWFGDAFLAHALNETTDFIDAYARAAALVATWERGQDYVASEPQIAEGERIRAKLEAWRATLPDAPRVEFRRD